MVDPGGISDVALQVAPRWCWYGRARLLDFAVLSVPEGEDAEPIRRNGRLIHHALIEPGMLVVALLAIALAAIFWVWSSLPSVLELRFEPKTAVAGTPVTVSWKAPHASSVELRVNQTPAGAITPSDGDYAITVVPTGTVTIDLEARHPLGFLSFLDDKKEIAIFAVTPTSTPAPIANPTSAQPEGATATTATATLQVPREPPTIIVTPTMTPTATILPTSTPTPTPPICQRGVPFGLQVEGLAGTPFLVYFDKRVVTGGSIKSDGKASVWLVVGDEIDNVQHSIVVRARGDAKATPFPIHTLDGRDELTSFYCVVPANVNRFP